MPDSILKSASWDSLYCSTLVGEAALAAIKLCCMHMFCRGLCLYKGRSKCKKLILLLRSPISKIPLYSLCYQKNMCHLVCTGSEDFNKWISTHISDISLDWGQVCIRHTGVTEERVSISIFWIAAKVSVTFKKECFDYVLRFFYIQLMDPVWQSK